MPLIANLTLAQLRTATKAQILTGISNYLQIMTKRQLIVFLLDADTIPDPPVRTFRADKQIESETQVERDAETGAITSTRRVDWTYYPTGEVDTITISTDAGKQIIKHYLDGRQPTIESFAEAHMAFVAPEPEKEPEYQAEPESTPDLTPEEKAPIERGVKLIIGLALILAALALYWFALR